MKASLLNSLPKSGTHILVRLLELLDYTDSGVHLSGSLVRPYRGKNLFKKTIKAINLLHNHHILLAGNSGLSVDLDFPKKQFAAQLLQEKVEYIKPGTFAEAHLPYSVELSEFLRANGIAVITILRDPRDVALSYVNHVTRDPNYPLHRKLKYINNIDQQVLYVISASLTDDSQVLSPLHNRLMNSIGWLSDPRICAVRFEELIGPKGGGDKENQLRAIEKIATHVLDDTGGLDVASLAEDLFFRRAETFHRGQIGSHKLLRPETISALEEDMWPLLERLGYMR